MAANSGAPTTAREHALESVRKLQAAGYQALWAGGCVRDLLLGRPPKDYDIATSATPEQIRAVFGRRRTLAIGQAFGVICLILPRGAGQIDIATFRRDAAYSDGRHPDQVTFSTAEEDARRRDFTINGLFYDPLKDEILDYVGGREDLRAGRIRAIGDPQARFAEDKLRLLRAVRFAAIFEFHLEEATRQSICQQACELSVVSAERIREELRQMLVHPQRRRAVELLDICHLLPVVLPEAPSPAGPERWNPMQRMLEQLGAASFPVVLAVLVRRPEPSASLRKLPVIAQRLRLTRQEQRLLTFLWKNETAVRHARRWPWPRLQRILIEPASRELLGYARVVAQVLDGHTEEIDFCEQQRLLPEDQLNPPALLTGADLRRAGVPPGPVYARVLEAVRDAQLEGRIHNADQAIQLAHHFIARETEDAE